MRLGLKVHHPRATLETEPQRVVVDQLAAHLAQRADREQVRFPAVTGQPHGHGIQIPGLHDVVGVKERHPLAARLLESPVARSPRPFARADKQPHARVRSRALGDDSGGSIRRGIIDDDGLHRHGRACQHAVERLDDGPLRVSRGHDDRHQRRHGNPSRSPRATFSGSQRWRYHATAARLASP